MDEGATMLDQPTLPFENIPETPAGKPVNNIQPIAFEIWHDKYRFKRADGTPMDMRVEDTWQRVAHHLSQNEEQREAWYQVFYDMLRSYEFLPAGRILAGAGTGYNVTLFNCYVMGTIHDSMPGIFQALKESALTLQQGGGIGNDFSSLRPKGAPVNGVGAEASGPLTFMDCWDTMCKTIMGAGVRRGAMMGTLRCDHPDIEEFIEAKREKKRFRNFNLSVLVTDYFMESVRAGWSWDLEFGGKVYKTIDARDLWNKIMQATYDCAEPGVIFIDRVNEQNNLNYIETINCTNPCGEQPLPPYGACLLGSVNLAVMVHDPFEPGAGIQMEKLTQTVRHAIRMLDNVVDVSNYPLPEQEVEAKNKRRLGLGVTGLADALAMCGLRYGSDEAAEQAELWMAEIETTAYLASAELAHEKGVFPLYNADHYIRNLENRGLPDHVIQYVANHGMRNSHVTSIAPTGTISQFAGNVSSGVEPIFAFEYYRKRLQDDNSLKTSLLRDFAIDLYMKKHDLTGEIAQFCLPEYFVTAQQLKPIEHLKMLAAVQRHVDSSVSKTVNVPKDISFADFKTVYHDAYDMGLKCCATYRPNDITGSVLSLTNDEVSDDDKKAIASAGPGQVDVLRQELELLTNPPERSEKLTGETYKLKWPTSDHAMYVTINDVVVDGQRRPYEIFINSKNMEHYSWIVGLTRMISAVFRRGGNVRFVVEELKAIFDPRGGAWVKTDGKTVFIPSLLAHIGMTIERHMIDIGFIDSPINMVETLDDVNPGTGLGQCPKCGAAAIVKEEGCERCMSCDFNKCE